MGNPDLNFTSTGAADTLVLVVGNFFLIVLLLYPLEAVRPGWLSLKRAGILLFPYAALSLLYYAGLVSALAKSRCCCAIRTSSWNISGSSTSGTAC